VEKCVSLTLSLLTNTDSRSPPSYAMDDYDSDEDFSDVSSIGSDLDDPKVDFCPVILSMCRAIYSPSSMGQSYVCTRTPPCRRHNHNDQATPRGNPGVYPVDRTRTGQVRGVLNNRLSDDDVQAMRERERDANRALASAQAGIRSPGQPRVTVETANPSSDDEEGYPPPRPTRNLVPTVPPPATARTAATETPIFEPQPDGPAANDVIPPAQPPQGDLSELVSQLTTAILGLNTRIARLETQPSPAPPVTAPPAARTPVRRAPEGILRQPHSTAGRTATTPDIEFVGTQRATTKEPSFLPPPQAWYVVLKGRTPRDIGIYDNWLIVQPMVSGVSHAVYKKFKTEPEAEYYLAGAMNSMSSVLEEPFTRSAPTPPYQPPSTPPPGDYRSHLPSQTPLPSNHGRASNTMNSANSLRGTPRGESESKVLKGTIRDAGVVPAGADPSTGQKDLLYGLHANEDGSVMRSCSPPGLTIDGQVRLADQVLDAVALPGTSDGGTDETELHRISESLQSIAAGRSSSAGYPVGQRDSNYKSKRKTSLCDIRSTVNLQDRLEDLEGGAEDILKYTEGNLKAVLINEGYDYEVASEYASLSPYLKISQVSLQSYVSLHLHLLSIAVNEGYDEAKMELAHHCKKMRRIRERYHTRLQVMCHLYCYLRDQKRNRWQSLEIQKLRLDQARRLLPFVSPSAALPSDNPASPGITSDYRCPHCRTSIHSGGKKSCPWRNLTVKKAISAAKQALNHVYAMGSEGLGRIGESNDLPADEMARNG
jgi:hypothetical protein